MTSRRDLKLERLAATPTGTGRSAHELLLLGRLGDVTTIEAGETLQREGERAPWTYCVLAGTALVSVGTHAVAVATTGAWLLGTVPGLPRRPNAATVVAATDIEVLAFRPHDLAEAVSGVAGLSACFGGSPILS